MVKVGHFHSLWHHLRRSPLQSLSAVLVMWLTFFVATVLVFILFIFSSVIGFFQTRPEVSAFIKDDISSSQLANFQKEIETMEGVKEVRYLSKEEALRIYTEQSQDNPMLLEMVNADILPASFEISTNNPAQLETIANWLSTRTDIVKEIIFQKDVVQKIIFWTSIIGNIGAGVVLMLGMVVFIVIVTIIAMKIAIHNDEITALRSIGATSWYIRAPFLLEGIVYGVIGSILSYLFVVLIFYNLRNEIMSFFSPIHVYPANSFIILVFAVEFTTAVFIGLFSAFIATGRYLKR